MVAIPKCGHAAGLSLKDTALTRQRKPMGAYVANKKNEQARGGAAAQNKKMGVCAGITIAKARPANKKIIPMLIKEQLVRAGETARQYRHIAHFLNTENKRLTDLIRQSNLGPTKAGLDLTKPSIQQLAKNVNMIPRRSVADFATGEQCQEALKHVALDKDTAALLSSLFDSTDYYKRRALEFGKFLQIVILQDAV
jgi:hypothetical protein